MNLTERAKLDNQFITQNENGFGIDITLVAPTGETIDIKGLHTKHHNGIDEDGNSISTKIASVAINESQLVNYPYRLASGDVSFSRHEVQAKDSTDVLKKYRVNQWYPDENLGIIVLLLADLV